MKFYKKNYIVDNNAFNPKFSHPNDPEKHWRNIIQVEYERIGDPRK